MLSTQPCMHRDHWRFVSGGESAGRGEDGPEQDRDPRIPMPDIPADGALMKMEVAGICGTDVKLYKTPADRQPGDHGPREHRRHRQGRPRIHPAQGLQGRRPRLRRALRRVRQMRVVPSRPVPPLREHRLAHTTPTASATATPRPRSAPHLWGGFAHMCTCRGTRSCTMCRKASRRSSRAWSRRWRTASNGRCSMAASATTPPC